MIALKDENLIARGGVRKVYQHPENPSLCIKVDARTSGNGAGVTLAEAKLFERLLKKRGHKEFSVISNYRGRVETDLGMGAMYDLVRDQQTGRPSQILMKLVKDDPDLIASGKFKNALKGFRRELVKEAVLCRDIRPWNICVQRLSDGDLKLVLIDGVGHVKKKWFERFALLVRIKMAYYFFSKYLYPQNRLINFYSKTKKKVTWSAGPVLSDVSVQQDKTGENQ